MTRGRLFPYIRAVAIALLVGLLVVSFLPGCGGKAKGETSFPSFVYASPQSLAGYQVAAEMPEVLRQIPCYCGCGPSLEHKDLRDCFYDDESGGFDRHAAGCDICGREAVDVKKLHGEGKSIQEIRNIIDERYAKYGEGTDTPFPAQ